MSNKCVTERLFQALLFEVLAVLLCTPLFAWLMGKGMGQMGALAAANSTAAVLWNMLFNAGADRLRARLGVAAGVAWRSAHAIAFEGTLALMTVPLAVWWLGISLSAAILLDAGLVAFFIPYTYAYHWVYDTLRRVLVRPC